MDERTRNVAGTALDLAPRAPAVNPSNNRLLVTEDAPAYGVLAAVRALRRAGYGPWLAVTGRDGYSLHSRACAGVVTVPDPSENSAGYLAAIKPAADRLERAPVDHGRR